ncbi:MAG: acetamidase/formamidase family protein, partial [Cyclobacteriaceae bacterium]
QMSQVDAIPEPQYSLTKDQTHNKFSRTIPPVLTVPSGSVIEMFTEEASDQQLTQDSDTIALVNISFDPIHPLTGPVFVEGAAPGDILAVRFHKIETLGWGWAAIIPGFGFLASEFPQRVYRTFVIDTISQTVAFNDKIKLPLKPFAGVIGVAPDTDSLLNTIPPRANGGNMDDPNITEGTTVYLPVFVVGALFSLGDAHVVQGLGEVSGTAIEAPMRFIVELNLLKGANPIKEPQYETDDYYAVTAFGTTIDIAAKKAVQYMIDYLMAEHQLEKSEAYMLCSFAGDLKIAEVVDMPHVLVTMHISKEVLGVK